MAKVMTSEEKEQAIEERRWKVWRLRVTRKLDISEIVQLVPVARRTVERDLATMRQQRDDHIRRAVAARQAALDAAVEVVEECDAITRQCWIDLQAAPAGAVARAKFLAVVLNTLTRRVEILQNLGLLDRAPEELVVSDGSTRDLTEEESRKLLGLIKAELRRREEVRSAPAPRPSPAGRRRRFTPLEGRVSPPKPA